MYTFYGNKVDQAHLTFENIGIKITTEGQRYLGGSIGPIAFTESYAHSKIADWEKELLHLCDILLSLSYMLPTLLSRMALFIDEPSLVELSMELGSFSSPLGDIILLKFIPALTGKDGISAVERNVFALPVRLGGLSIVNPVQQASHYYI